MSTKYVRSTLLQIILITMILSFAASGITTVSAASRPAFTGNWESIDVDGNPLSLNIAGPPAGPFLVVWTEYDFDFCGEETGVLQGDGWISEEDEDVLEVDFILRCVPSGATMEFHQSWQYYPDIEMLSSPMGSENLSLWSRPSKPYPPPPPLGLRVNYGHDWVEGFYEAGHTVWVVVTESDGLKVKGIAELATEPKDFWEGETGFTTNPEDWYPVMPDIQPYDWVYGWADKWPRGKVQIGDISGKIYFESDTIEGAINAQWIEEDVDVECFPWGAPDEQEMKFDTIKPDGSATYACSWEGDWDIQPGQDVGVAYITPDGNWVANVFAPYAYIVASVAGDFIWTSQFNQGDLTISVYETPDSEDPSWSEVVQANEDGFALVEPDDTFPDLIPGYYVTVSGTNAEKGIVLEEVMVEMFDIQYDFMTGTAPPGSEVWVATGPQEHQDGLWVDADASTGEWLANFAGYVDLDEDMAPWSYAQLFDNDMDINEGDPPPLETWAGLIPYDISDWSEGDHTYQYETMYSFPVDFSGESEEITFNVSDGASLYEGYVLLRPHALWAQVDDTCQTIDPVISLAQDTRFLYGWVTDYPMTYIEAQAHYGSLSASVNWDGINSIALDFQEIQPWYEDTWIEYICTFTQQESE